MKVLFLTNIPSPYRVDFFNELGKLCDLTVFFEKDSSAERDDSWKNYKTENFKSIILKGKSIGVASACCPSVVKLLKKNRYDKIVVCNYSDPTGWLAIHYLRRYKIPYWIEGDGAFAKNGIGIKERLKKFFLKGAQGYFSTGKEHDNYYITYGVGPEKIYRYPFTSVLLSGVLDEVPNREEKDCLKEELGVGKKKMVLSVGQFIYRKGFDILLLAARNVLPDTEFYIVGGEATLEYIELKEKYQLNNVHFVGFKDKQQLEKYYKAADLFVLPTREDIWGLVINEAMAKGLPIISTNRCIAATELVLEGENGYIVAVEDYKLLSEKINLVLCDLDRAEKMGRCSLEIIKSFTIEKMAQRHIEVFENE